MIIYSNPLILYLGKLRAQCIFSKLIVELCVFLKCLTECHSLTITHANLSEEYRVQILHKKEITHLPSRGVLLVHSISGFLIGQTPQQQSCKHVT